MAKTLADAKTLEDFLELPFEVLNIPADIDKDDAEQVERAKLITLARWTKIGMSTDEPNKSLAESAVFWMYEQASLPKPHIIWTESPYASCEDYARIYAATQYLDVLKAWQDQLLSDFKSEAASKAAKNFLSRLAAAYDQQEDPAALTLESVQRRRPAADFEYLDVYAEFREKVVEWLGKAQQLRQDLQGSPLVEVLKSLDEVLIDPTHLASIQEWYNTGLRDGSRYSIYGQHDAVWLASYEFLYRVFKVQECERLQGLWDFAMSAGWLLPCYDVCWISAKPKIIRVDDQNRPHCVDGPATQFPDGWSIWAIEGVALNEQIVMRPETQTIADITNETNEERKRIRINRFAGRDKDPYHGWLRFVRESGAVQLDTQFNERDQQWERVFKMPDSTVFFECRDPSTGRQYLIQISKEVKNCEEARDFMSFGMDKRILHRS